MTGEVRQRMVEGAARLLAERGLQGTSFTEVLQLTGAPRGSIYHHFPHGKDQLVGAALGLAGERALAGLDGPADATAEQVATQFLDLWRALLTRAHFEVGCAVLAVTVAAPDPALLEQAATVFRTWREGLARRFEHAGLEHRVAAALATTLVAASEGAVVLSRAERSTEPFDLVAQQMLDQVRAASRTGSARGAP
ncbi:TetR/AcrR family transcriptional regulator [Cellulomonas hominis]